MTHSLCLLGLLCSSAVGQNTTVYHPADNNPADSVISDEELAAYSQAWRGGEVWPAHNGLIPIDFVTNAAQIVWEFNGNYEYEEGSDPDNSGSYNGSVDENGSVIIGIGDVWLIPTTVYWRPARVYFTLEPTSGKTAFAAEMPVPDGWHYLPYAGHVADNDGDFLDTMPDGSLDTTGRTVRWGPYPADVLPTYYGFELIAMDGEILPETSDLSATISYDGSREAITTFDTTEPWLEITFGNYGASLSDPGLRLDGPLLERAFAGRANRPRKDFAPVFERYTDEYGQDRMRCTLAREVIYPEMGFTVQRTTNFSDWEPVEVTWRLTEQVRRNLTFETTFPCLDSDQPEIYRVLVHENVDGAANLTRTVSEDGGFSTIGDEVTLPEDGLPDGDWSGGGYDGEYDFGYGVPLGLYVPPGANQLTFDPDDTFPLVAYHEDATDSNLEYQIVIFQEAQTDEAFAQLLASEHYDGSIYEADLLNEAAARASTHSLQLLTLSDGGHLLISADKLTNAPSQLRDAIVGD